MIIKVENNPEKLTDGEYVLFITGKKKVGTYPSYLRIGQVVDAKNWAIKELSTGEIFKVYTGDVIKTGSNHQIFGVGHKFVFTDKI